MATITRRGTGQYQAKVRLKGHPTQSRTFLYKEDAERWARATERELETSGFVDRREAERTPLHAVLKRYRTEITPRKKSADIEAVKIGVLLKDTALTNLTMAVPSFTAKRRNAKKGMRLHSIAMGVLCALALSACGGGGGGTSPTNAPTSGASPSAVPTITAQPLSQAAVAGSAVTFTVAATGDALTYQWQNSANAGITWTDSPLSIGDMRAR